MSYPHLVLDVSCAPVLALGSEHGLADSFVGVVTADNCHASSEHDLIPNDYVAVKETVLSNVDIVTYGNSVLVNIEGPPQADRFPDSAEAVHKS